MAACSVHSPVLSTRFQTTSWRWWRIPCVAHNGTLRWASSQASHLHVSETPDSRLHLGRDQHPGLPYIWGMNPLHTNPCLARWCLGVPADVITHGCSGKQKSRGDPQLPATSRSCNLFLPSALPTQPPPSYSDIRL